MRIILPESARPRKRAVGGTFLSAVVHVAIIGGTIAATGWTAETVRSAPDERPPKVTFVKQIDDPPHTPPSKKIVGPVPTHVVPPVAPLVVPLDFVIRGGLPPVDLIIGSVAIDTFARMPVAESGRTPPGSSVGSETPMTSATVDRQVVPMPGSATPRYPSMLASAGVEGEVVLQYVVDTLGRVERTSVRSLRSDHPEFERSVRAALERMTFVPAEAGGRKVRQLVEQAFTFAMRGGGR